MWKEVFPEEGVEAQVLRSPHHRSAPRTNGWGSDSRWSLCIKVIAKILPWVRPDPHEHMYCLVNLMKGHLTQPMFWNKWFQWPRLGSLRPGNSRHHALTVVTCGVFSPACRGFIYIKVAASSWKTNFCFTYIFTCTFMCVLKLINERISPDDLELRALWQTFNV